MLSLLPWMTRLISCCCRYFSLSSAVSALLAAGVDDASAAHTVVDTEPAPMRRNTTGWKMGWRDEKETSWRRRRRKKNSRAKRLSFSFLFFLFLLLFRRVTLHSSFALWRGPRPKDLVMAIEDIIISRLPFSLVCMDIDLPINCNLWNCLLPLVSPLKLDFLFFTSMLPTTGMAGLPSCQLSPTFFCPLHV